VRSHPGARILPIHTGAAAGHLRHRKGSAVNSILAGAPSGIVRKSLLPSLRPQQQPPPSLYHIGSRNWAAAAAAAEYAAAVVAVVVAAAGLDSAGGNR